jgi:uncharacterized cupredoxin-like copper-binding protein
MVKKLSILVIFLLSLSLVMNACGAKGPSTNLKVSMVEFMYDPSSYIIPAGQEITLELSNNGAVVHTFIIMKYGTNVGADFGPEDEENIYWKAELEPGTSNTFTFTAPSEPGEYQVVCGTEGHFLAGMSAKLTVVAP